MCRLPKVVVVAPADRHDELRRALTSIAYDIAAIVSTPEEIDVDADAAVLVDPRPETVEALHARDLKVAAVGEDGHGADICLSDAAAFKERVWDLFRTP